MNTKPLDKSKKSNIKCEHCEYWDGICTGKSWSGHNDAFGCTNKESAKYNTPTNYWNRCKYFKWKESIKEYCEVVKNE